MKDRGQRGLIMAMSTSSKRRRLVGNDAANGSMPIERLAEEIVRQLKAEGQTLKTCTTVWQVFRMLKQCGVQTAAQLDDRAVQRFMTAGPDLAPCTRASRLRSLRSYCTRAFSLGVISAIPSFPRIPQSYEFLRTKTPAPSPEEIKRFLDYLRGKVEAEGDWIIHRTFALVTTLAYAGLSRAESQKFRVSDVDFERGMILVRTRKASSRSMYQSQRTMFPPQVPMQPELVAVLRAWLPKTGCEWVFPGVRRLGPWGPHQNPVWARNPVNLMREQACVAGIGATINFATLRRFYVENAALVIPGISLDSTPRLGAKIDAPKTVADESLEKPRPSVTIGEPWEPVFIRGKLKGVLSRSEHRIILVLLQAFPGGLTMKQMEASTGMGGWRKTLERLVEDPDWKGELFRPRDIYKGKRSQFYRINEW
jgi:integrase